MCALQTDPQIEDYLKRLTAKYPTISEIWLLGSRANEAAREDSDWDLFVFGTTGLVNQLREDIEFHIDQVDMLVVDPATGEFEKPWGLPKSGTLEEWHWRQRTETEAEYQTSTFSPVCTINGFEVGPLETQVRKALRVWQR